MRTAAILLAAALLAGCGSPPRRDDPIVIEALSIVPAQGRPGDVVRIYGANLTWVAFVTFNETPARVLEAYDDLLVVQVPWGAASGVVNAENAMFTRGGPLWFEMLDPLPPVPLSHRYSPPWGKRGAEANVSGPSADVVAAYWDRVETRVDRVDENATRVGPPPASGSRLLLTLANGTVEDLGPYQISDPEGMAMILGPPVLRARAGDLLTLNATNRSEMYAVLFGPGPVDFVSDIPLGARSLIHVVGPETFEVLVPLDGLAGPLQADPGPYMGEPRLGLFEEADHRFNRTSISEVWFEPVPWEGPVVEWFGDRWVETGHPLDLQGQRMDTVTHAWIGDVELQVLHASPGAASLVAPDANVTGRLRLATASGESVELWEVHVVERGETRLVAGCYGWGDEGEYMGLVGHGLAKATQVRFDGEVVTTYPWEDSLFFYTEKDEGWLEVDVEGRTHRVYHTWSYEGEC